MSENPFPRIESIDALRGFDMMFIMGFAGLVVALCGALGFGNGCWLASQMEHPAWIGLTHHDTIFPLFIFIAGLTFPFSAEKQFANGKTRLGVSMRILKRMLVLVLLGMCYEGFFKGTPFRFGSVLGRIGIAWAAAAWLYVFFGVRTRIALVAAAILSYWGLNLFVAAPDNPAASVFTPQGNIVCWVDRTVLAPLGRIAPGSAGLPFDNQSLLSNVMAAVSAMFGVFTGEFVKKTRNSLSGDAQALRLALAAAAMAATACVIAFGCGRFSFPFSKPLWSPSFTFAVGSYSVAMFALFYWLIDVKGWWRNTLFFRVIGMNAIAIYIAQPLFSFRHAHKMIFGRFLSFVPEQWTDVASCATYMVFCWAFLYFLHRKKIYFKV